jgi:hypothetical protein
VAGRGHASITTTSIYLAYGEDRRELVVELRKRGLPSHDADRDATLAKSKVENAWLEDCGISLYGQTPIA